MGIKRQLTNWVKRVLRPRGKTAFLANIQPKQTILDIGCGNNSPYYAKQIAPGCYYIGVDVGDTNQTLPILADKYVITTPDEFASAIGKFNGVDYVVSSHNLEHCNHREATLDKMLAAVKPGGMIYLSFPSEASAHFPHRYGPLNYYDEETHLAEPPKFDWVMSELARHGYQIAFSARKYQPFITRCLGALVEPISRLRGKVMIGTWDYYGFETVIWGVKR